MIDWVGNLSAGDVVYIRMFREDKVHQRGELWRTRITEVIAGGDIVVEGHGVFSRETAHKDSGAMIEKPRIAVEIEYILQCLSEMRDRHRGTRTHLKVEYEGQEVTQRGFSEKKIKALLRNERG